MEEDGQGEMKMMRRRHSTAKDPTVGGIGSQHPKVSVGLPQSVEGLQFQSRVQDEQWAASLGSRPASAAAVFGGTAAGLHNGTLSACQPRVPPRCPKRLNPAFRLFSLSLETTQLYPSSMT